MEVRKQTVNDLQSVISSDPFLILLEGLKKDRVETIRRLDAHDERIGVLEEKSRAPTMIRGKPHMAVIPFLANRDIEVPEGSPRPQGTSRKMPLFRDPDDEPSKRSHDGWTYYSIVGTEFREIAEVLGYKVNDRSCPKILTYESGFKARHYPVEWLEKIARIWIERNRRRFDRRRWFKNVS